MENFPTRGGLLPPPHTGRASHFITILVLVSVADREGSLRCCVTDDLDHRPHALRSINDFVPLDRRTGWGSVSRFETSRIQRRASPINARSSLDRVARVSFLPLLVHPPTEERKGTVLFSVRANQIFPLVKWNSLPLFR